MAKELRVDEIGYWSEVKLDIIKKYAAAYSTILTKQSGLSHVYIDAFSGGGVHIRKKTKELVTGSPINALEVTPPFTEYHFIDLDDRKIEALQGRIGLTDRDVHLYPGSCNAVLLDEVFPKVKYENYRRGLCLLDPYGLHLNWEVMRTAGDMKSLEIFLNFPVMDMNRNVLWKNQDNVTEANKKRMNDFWGDETWQDVAYSTQPGLFEMMTHKEDNKVVAQGFQERLKKVAGFKYVPDPMPMRNSSGAIVYYLFFASQNSTGAHIVEDIFKRHRERGM